MGKFTALSPDHLHIICLRIRKEFMGKAVHIVVVWRTGGSDLKQAPFEHPLKTLNRVKIKIVTTLFLVEMQVSKSLL